MKRVGKLKIGKAEIDCYLEKNTFYIDYHNIEIDDFDTKKKFDEMVIEKMKLDKLVFEKYKNLAIEKIKEWFEKRNIGNFEEKFRVIFTIKLFCIVFFNENKILVRLLKFDILVYKLFRGFIKRYYLVKRLEENVYDKFYLTLDDEIKNKLLIEMI